ncbi:hypothetical protein JAAARDRAFT_651143 [Jaapia argillacea MUCL 33604]|uniref:Uncharacterized protein n=1 Tax=Jaapia argillacea MUCL 33604 TaxID=933084 RepID=A0A067Q8W8_9AGAM|nr:hypothetical protein JAAARDRAFT_651143 [Jaapia argillacea MUCL 33604]
MDVPTPSTISSTTIAALEALVIYFVTETVQRAIVSKEQERELKAHTKVWRIGKDQVRLSLPPHFHHHLASLPHISITIASLPYAMSFQLESEM